MTRMLVSVRDVGEALAAAAAGADFIDLKDPAAGALGGLPVARIAAIVQVLRARHPGLPVSATIGDLAMARRDEIVESAIRVARCGVDYVKVGLARAPAGAAADGGDANGSQAAMLLRRLARCGAAIVPVLIADDGIDDVLVHLALSERAFPALMLDTADKRGANLLERIEPAALAAFVRAVQAAARLAGLAGALRASDVPALTALAPDFAGFRSAVCVGERAGPLDPRRVRDLGRRLAAGAPAAARSAVASCAAR